MRFRFRGKYYRLRTWRLIMFLVLLMAMVDLLFIGTPKVHNTPEGAYVCEGGLIQICRTDTKEVYDKYGN